LVDRMEDVAGCSVRFTSFGPTHADVAERKT
jgi:hypothetical protein